MGRCILPCFRWNKLRLRLLKLTHQLVLFVHHFKKFLFFFDLYPIKTFFSRFFFLRFSDSNWLKRESNNLKQKYKHFYVSKEMSVEFLKKDKISRKSAEHKCDHGLFCLQQKLHRIPLRKTQLHEPQKQKNIHLLSLLLLLWRNFNCRKIITYTKQLHLIKNPIKLSSLWPEFKKPQQRSANNDFEVEQR